MKTLHQIQPAPGDTLRHERGGLHTYNHQNHITGRHYVKDTDGNIYRVTETSLWEAIPQAKDDRA